MCASFDNRNRGHQRQFGFVPQLRNCQRTAVAHRRTYLGERGCHTVRQCTGIGDIGINAFFKAQFCCAAEIISLPVTRTGAALAPVFLHIAAADEDLAGGRLVKAREVAAQHAEVRAHCKRQRDVIVLHNAAVGTDGNIYASLFKIAVALRGNINDSGRLTAADALGLTRNTDRAAADADFYEIRACICQEAEALAIDHVSGANLDGIAVVLTDPFERPRLPLGIALGRVNDQHVYTRLDKRRHAFGVIARVDARAYHIAFLSVQKFERISLVRVIVLTEYERDQMAVGRDNGKGVELVLPDDVVRFLEACSLGCRDNFFHRSHERGNGNRRFHPADAVVAAGNDAKQFTCTGSVIGHGHGGMAGALLKRQNIRQRVAQAQVGIARDEARFIVFDLANHLGLLLNRLRDVDECDATFFRQANAHLFTGDRLHNGRNHGYVHGQRAIFTFLEFHNRGLERDVRGDAVGGGIAGYQQVLAEGMRRFRKIVCHEATSFQNFRIYHTQRLK